MKQIIEKKEDLHLEIELNGDFEYWHKVQSIFLSALWTGQEIRCLETLDRLQQQPERIQRMYFRAFFEKYNHCISDFNKEFNVYKTQNQDVFTTLKRGTFGVVKW